MKNFTSGLIGQHAFVTSVVPQDNGLRVPVGTNVTGVFSEAVDPNTVKSTSFRLLDPSGVPVAASVGLAPDGRTATLDPMGSLAFNTVYTVEVTSEVKDLSGLPAAVFSKLLVKAAA